MTEMKTLTINNKTYEVVDATARASIEELAEQIEISGFENPVVKVTLLDLDGNPVSGVAIRGIRSKGGVECITDANGYCMGEFESVESSTITLFTDEYFDLKSISTAVTAINGECEHVTMQYTRNDCKDFNKITESCSVVMSPLLKKIDVTAVGGGQGGHGCSFYLTKYNDGDDSVNPGTTFLAKIANMLGQGGNGGLCVVQEDVSFNSLVSVAAVVGAGGAGGDIAGRGGAGGTTSFLGVSAAGGSDSNVNGAGATGATIKFNSSGGCTWSKYPSGSSGTVAGYSSATETVMYGGGGGLGACSGLGYQPYHEWYDDDDMLVGGYSFKGAADHGASSGGTLGGGAGGSVSVTTANNGTAGTANTGGGGGGGALYHTGGYAENDDADYDWDTETLNRGKGGNGGSGIITCRFHH